MSHRDTPPRGRLAVRRAVPALVALAVLVALAAPAPALARGPFTVRLHAHGHRPHVGNWPISATITRRGRGLSGSVRYRFLYRGQVVSTQPGGRFRRGRWHNTMTWPRRAVGHRITLQIVFRTRYGTRRINWWIQVRR